MAKEETLKVLACLAHHPDSSGPGTDEVPHRFVGLIGHPHSCQFARPVEPGQHHGITPICFDPVT
jgi:hypothetical protein